MPTSEHRPLLNVGGLVGGYRKLQVIRGIDLDIAEGEVVTLLGANGSGKSTLLRLISGLLPRQGGSVVFDGAVLPAGNPRAAVDSGITHVLEGHRVFTELSVYENFLVAAYGVPGGERGLAVEEALEAFPELTARRHEKAATLSGGQQMMLAIAQALVQRPRLLMLDEPSSGLAPVLVTRVLELVRRLAGTGTSILLVEQLVRQALSVADRACVLAGGRIVLLADAREPDLISKIESAYLG